MGHYCKICGRTRANERFSGKGHKQHICKECMSLPVAERESILQEDEIFGFLHQSHISEKNIKRLHTLAESPYPTVAEHAALVLEIAAVKEYKRRRLTFLGRNHPDLLERLEETGLIYAHHW